MTPPGPESANVSLRSAWVEVSDPHGRVVHVSDADLVGPSLLETQLPAFADGDRGRIDLLIGCVRVCTLTNGVEGLPTESVTWSIDLAERGFRPFVAHGVPVS